MTIAHTRYLIEKYGSDAVPRYTSYPTALQFRDYQSSHDLSFFWRTVDSSRPVSLYIHIPFCHSLCHYCGCHTKIVGHTSIISAYIDILCREMELVAASLPEKLQVSRVHFGGGSPNYTCLDDIEKILLKIRSLFYTTNDIKIDMECDPRLLDREKIKGLANLGLSRISLGIQDFDPIVQKVINRIQSYEHISRQVIDIRESGIHDINFDIIIGLPEQTLASIQSTASKCIEMRPSRIAVFSYAHVP